MKILASMIALLLWSSVSADPLPPIVPNPITVDPELESNPAAVRPWLTYGVETAMNKNVDKYTREVSGRQAMAREWKYYTASNRNAHDPYLDDLVKIADAGFIREYVHLFIVPAPDQVVPTLRLQAYNSWALANIPNHKVVINAGIHVNPNPTPTPVTGQAAKPAYP